MKSINKRDIAIIGMSGRFPKSTNIQAFWENLMQERELSHFYSDEELAELGVDNKIINTPNYIKVDSFIEDAGAFDFAFFGYTPDEATMMNPQTRLFHQHVWSALEDAGCNIDNYNKKIGIFAGANNDLNWNLHVHINSHKNIDPYYLSKISNPNYMCSLIAYKLNLKGPCYFSDTACSTSLTASHMACRSLLMNECSIAIAGGVKLLSNKDRGYFHHEGGIMSRDGHCRAFDINSSGAIAGEGIGVVVMKRLSEAIEEGDNIYAVVKGSAVNNDGNRKAGYTMPSVKGQTECIKLAHLISNVKPGTISYVEAHGTGTAIGDAIEVKALNEAFNNNNNLNTRCVIGSVKTNMGHLDEAAGIAGLIKVTQALYKKELPASINFQENNPLIDFSGGPFYVNAKSTKWINKKDTPLRAGINSLGIGGTNVHMILEEPPIVEDNNINIESHHLIMFSAKTLEALKNYENDLLHFLNKKENLNFDDFSYTLQTGRKQFDCRGFIVCKNQYEAIKKLNNKHLIINKTSSNKEIVFMFSGQGSQYYNMGKQLYDEKFLFKRLMDEGFEFLAEYTKEDYKKILFGENKKNVDKINNTNYTQPLLFLFEYALAKQLIELGIRPQYMIGHSLGEYVAACISGVFSFEDALRLILKRASLMSKMKKGNMLSILGNYDSMNKDILNGVSIAAINSPISFVVSGTVESIETTQKRLDENQISYSELKTSHAFHSEMMNDMIDDYISELNTVKFSKPNHPFISNVTGDFITEDEATSPNYWAKHLLKTVEFKKGINTLTERGDFIFVEIGPGNALATLSRQSIPNTNSKHVICNTIRHIKEDVNDNEHLLKTLGVLWSNGIDIDWSVYYGNSKRRKLSLPTYPFEMNIFPTKVAPYVSLKDKGMSMIDNTKGEVSKWFYLPGWKQTFLIETKSIATEEENYLMFSNSDNFSQLLKQKLQEEGKNVLEVFKGDDFFIEENSKVKLRTDSKEDYDSLAIHLTDIEFEINTIIYCWNLDSNNQNTSQNHIQEDIFESCIHLKNILVLIKSNIINAESDKKIVFLSNNEFNIENEYNLSAQTAISHSFLHVLSQEYTNIFSCFIDFDIKSVGNKLISSIYKELLYNEKDIRVSIRNNKRWCPSYTNIELDYVDKLDSSYDGLNILITGGLGFVGFVLAEHFMENYNANVLLIGRKNLSEDMSKSKRLESLKNYSGVVTYKECNVSDFNLLSEKIDQWESENGKISGIIHAAGNPDITSYEIVSKTDKTSFDNQFNSKAKGILNLYKIFKKRDLKFVRATSSLSVILGGLTYSAYAAANHFMDVFILSKRDELKNWMTINFDGISSTDDMYINSKELIEVFEQSLSIANAQIIVSIKDMEKAIEYVDKLFKQQEELTQFKAERPDLSVDYIHATSETEKKLTEIWEKVLGINKIGIRDNFFELGGHSLMVGQIINHIYKELNESISFKEFLSDPTIAQISKKLLKTYYSPIPKAPITKYYPLTPSQHRIWVLSQLEGGNSAYNMLEVFRFKGNLDVIKFEEALRQLIRRHEILRTSFKVDESWEIHQHIISENAFDFEIKEKDFLNRTKNDIETYLKEQSSIAFDLTKAPLLRASLLKIRGQEYIFSLTMHHIIGDGWSVELLISEVVQYYNNLVQNKEYRLPELYVQYKDYAVWLNEELEKEQYKTSESYWLSQFQGDLPVLDLPSFRSRPQVQTYNGKTLTHTFSKDLLEKLHQFSRANDATLFMTLMSGVNALLYRYTNQNDIIIGTPIAGREHPDLENQIGLYLNTLAIRTTIEDSCCFLDLLEHQKQTLLSAYEHQKHPFDGLINKLNLKRDISRSVLFDVMVVLHNQRSILLNEELDLEGLEIMPYNRMKKVSQFDMTFSFFESLEGLQLELEYNIDIYDKEIVGRLIKHLEAFISKAISNPKQELDHIDYLSKEEKHQLLYTFNDTKVDYPKNKTIIDLFVEQIKITPDNVAVVFEDKELTYQELDALSNQLANYLFTTYNIEVEDLIGVQLERSEWLIISLLAVMKTGAAYVPIDPNYPEQRIAYIKEDSNCKLVIDDTLLEKFKKKEDNVSTLPKVDLEPNNLAYVIYTSGSTGNPKGVLNYHSGLHNRLLWMKDDLKIDAEDVILQKTPYTFDVSVWELMMPAITGCKLVFAKPEGHKDPIYLQELIATEQITIMHFVPSMLSVFLEELDAEKCKTLKHVICSGEELSPVTVEKFKHKLPWCSIHNLYGPTEAAIDVTSIDLTTVDTNLVGVTIGKPVANTRIHIVDKHLSQQPIGVHGELLIEGIQVAKGYLNRLELNADKFIDSPFHTGERIYRTGDLAKWLPNGEIAYIGRIDHQVKLRGYRIELGEIEQSILKFEGIKQVAAEVKPTNKDKAIVAYIVSEEKIDKQSLREFIAQSLPEYMIPSYFVDLDAIPLTENGKIDRKALPEIDATAIIKKEYVAPRNELEEKLAQIWQKVLGVEKIGILDNFFELGGNSLTIIKLQHSIQKEFYVSVNIVFLFNNTTIEKQSLLIQKDLESESEKNPIKTLKF